MTVKSSHLATHQEADGLVYVPFAKRYTYQHSDLDAANAISFPIPTGTSVLGVSHRVLTPFDNAADLDIGDSANPAGYLAQAALAPTVANDFAFSLGGAGAYAQGKHYPAADRVVLTFTADPDAGAGEVMIYFAGLEE